MTTREQSGGVVDVEALAVAAGGEVRTTPCQVIREDALTLDVEAVGRYTLMWTPSAAVVAQGFSAEDGLLGDDAEPEAIALALGFALSEGLVRSSDDIRSLARCPDDPGVVRLQLRDPARVSPQRRDVLVDSACGICGPREILDENALGLVPVGDQLRLDPCRVEALMQQMATEQGIFRATGGAHAAAIFDPQGVVLAVAEDLGRHNALDKAIGLALLKRGAVAGCGVTLSSRLSLEMVVKAVRCGLEIVLAVSAPTSLAIEVAERFDLTLCGFVRDGRMTVFSHSHRIAGG